MVEVTVENSEAPIQGGILTVVSIDQIEDRAAAQENIRLKKGIPVKIKVTNADILPKHLDLGFGQE